MIFLNWWVIYEKPDLIIQAARQLFFCRNAKTLGLLKLRKSNNFVWRVKAGKDGTMYQAMFFFTLTSRLIMG